MFSLLLGIAEQSQALSAAIDANTEEKRLLSRLLMKTKKAQTNASDLQRYCIHLRYRDWALIVLLHNKAILL